MKESKRPRVLIDADACPVTKEVLSVARRYKLPVIIVGNSTQNLKRHLRGKDPTEETNGFWVDTISVSTGMDSADFAIVEALKAGDIVVTQDIGLAAMVLGGDAYAIGVRGREYLPATIDMDMEMRHIEKKLRRLGGRTTGPPPFTEDDREHFAASLERVVEKALA